MRILFTGASSFTGMWFVKELLHAGHEVHTPLLHSNYTGIREKRVCELPHVYPNVAFGSEKFLELIASKDSWDILCHHAAMVTNYKSPQFDYSKALANNTHQLETVIDNLKKRGCERIVLTGSVFEQEEGEGSDDLRAVSPYGLSKGLTYAVFSYFSTIKKLKLGKFVIPNPFGPYEEERFTTFLIKTWYQQKIAPITHPEYVRDNIPVSLLAKAYLHFVETLKPSPGFEKINPSGYSGSMGDFTSRFAEEMRPRLNIPCAFELLKQEDFSEPRVRVNTDILDKTKLNWNEKTAWDELACYYQDSYGY